MMGCEKKKVLPDFREGFKVQSTKNRPGNFNSLMQFYSLTKKLLTFIRLRTFFTHLFNCYQTKMVDLVES